MGIQNRDYMKRPLGDEGRDGSSSDSRAEAFIAGFLQRHPRFFIYVTVGLALLIGAAIIAAKLSSRT